MTLEEKQRKIKIAYLIIIILAEKQRRILKEKGLHVIPLTIANATEIIFWIVEIRILQSTPIYKKGGIPSIKPGKEIIINRK